MSAVSTSVQLAALSLSHIFTVGIAHHYKKMSDVPAVYCITIQCYTSVINKKLLVTENTQLLKALAKMAVDNISNEQVGTVASNTNLTVPPSSRLVDNARVLMSNTDLSVL